MRSLTLLALTLMSSALPAQTSSGFVDVPGARLFYEARGSGEPLILIHGGFLDRRMWDPQIDAFAERNRVVRYDQRGAGRTVVTDSSAYSPVADLIALMDHLEIPRAAIVALSGGGLVAFDMAIAHPVRVSALVAAETLPRGFPLSPQVIQDMMGVMNVLAEQGRDSAVALFLTRPVFGTAVEQEGVAGRLREMLHDNLAWPLPQRPPEAMAVNHLNELPMPVLIILGGVSGSDAHAAAEQLIREVPNVHVVRIPAAGHMVNMEAPVAFNRAVLAFLNR